MEPRITFDDEANAGYIYLLPATENYNIQATEDVKDKVMMMVDIDEHDRIVGIECFGEIAQKLSSIAGAEKIYHANGEVLSFRITEKVVEQTYLFKGIRFCFADDKCKDFIGVDIVDFHKYDKKLFTNMMK